MPVRHKWQSGYDYKVGEPTYTTKAIGPAKAIREFCLQCYGFCENVAQEIKDCPSKDCALWPFRFGKDPGRGADMSPEERKRRSDHLKGYRRNMALQ